MSLWLSTTKANQNKNKKKIKVYWKIFLQDKFN